MNMTKLALKGGAVGRHLIFLFLLLGLGACHSGWNQDPLEGEDWAIKNALQPDEEVNKIPPPDQGVLFVRLNQVYSVVEGKPLEISFDYRIAHPDVNLSSIQVQGLEDKFPGSEFDSDNKVIRITPPLDFVPVDVPYVTETISLSFFWDYEGQKQEVKRDIVVHVIPQNESIPVIKDIYFEPAGLKVSVGQEKFMVIEVEDASKDYSPRISVMNAFGRFLPIAQYIESPAEGEYDENKGRWVFRAPISIPINYAITPGKRAKVDVFAYSITGIPSRSLSQSITVEGRYAQTPKIVSENEISMLAGQVSHYTFSAYDNRSAGRVTATCEGLSDGLRCQCRADSANNGIHICTLTNTVELEPGTYHFTVLAQNRLPNGTSSERRRRITVQVRSAQ
jgi:hypothetical protein